MKFQSKPPVFAAWRARFVAIAVAVASLVAAPSSRAEGLLDLCDVVGARDNQLVGYGIVTGLSGTGDDASVQFAAQSLKSLLRRLGVQIDQRQLRLRNVAAVMVTANIPPFSRPGSRIDVTVSSIGSARSLVGGVLVQTPLRGADRRVYAVGQGALVVGGFSASGATGSSVRANTTTTARVPSGALIERGIATEFATGGVITLALRDPSFVNAALIADALSGAFGKGTANALDGGAVQLKLPKDQHATPVQALAKLAAIEVAPKSTARVVINERTGTIVAGGDVRLAPVAIAQGGITISIAETPQVSQPGGPFTTGETTVVPESTVGTEEARPALSYVNAATTLADVAQALSTFGVTPRELASLLQALRAAGALRAEIIVQ